MVTEKLCVVLYTDFEVVVENLPTYEAISETVEGFIEIVPIKINGEDYDIIVNEEGKLLQLPMTALYNIGCRVDRLLGNIIITKHDSETDERLSLTTSEISNIVNYINKFLIRSLNPIFYLK